MLELSFHSGIESIGRERWQGVLAQCPEVGGYPFLRYDFLFALESSGAVSAENGWQPQHVLIEDGGEAIGVLPLYIKSHSYGEYVFDWSWADAYRRYGRNYYPKLLSAIPFTPATGPRLCVVERFDRDVLSVALVEQLQQRAEKLDASSIHVLFPEESMSACWQRHGLMQRCGPQYHWFNRDYRSYDDFLAACASRKRKNLRKERRRVVEQGLRLERLEGGEVSEAQWQFFFHCYQLTYAKRSGHGGYLNEAFFRHLASSMPEQMLLVLAYDGDQPVAAALNFRDEDTLYGRYWGCVREYEFLHFEACYYQGIEYCIEKGLGRFDPGAQGEHKIPRGFEPVMTYSNHWLTDPAFSDAVAQFLKDEREHILGYLDDAAEMLPYKNSE